MITKLPTEEWHFAPPMSEAPGATAARGPSGR
jgi:hypothetical protein